MKKCPWCGKEYSDEQTLCSTDGKELRVWPEKKSSAGSNVSLPLAIRRKQPFFESLSDQLIREQHPALTITNEGISYNRVAKAVSFKWPEIDFIRYVTRSKNFLTIEAGLQVFPRWPMACSRLDVLGLERNHKEIFEVVKQTFAMQGQRQWKSGYLCRPIRPMPEVPLEVRLNRKLFAPAVVVTVFIFFVGFCFFESARWIAVCCAAIGISIILGWLQRCIDRSAKITFTADAIKCNRLRQKRIIPLKDVSHVDYGNSGILMHIANQPKPVRLRVGLLELPADDLYRILLAVLENSRSVTYGRSSSPPLKEF